MASNSWVIHGNHTKSGLPLLVADPHLKNSIPAEWTLVELMWGEHNLIGATIVGLPGVQIGRTKTFAWGCTTPRVDNTDLWEEEVDDDFT